MPKKSEKKDNVRKLPYNVEIEQYLLGEILINNDTALDCVPNLKNTDFFQEENKIIFEAMVRLQASNKPIDFLTLTDELRLMGKLDEVGGEEYITSLTNGVVSAVNAKEHLEMVKRDSVLRQLVEAGNAICEIGYSGVTGEEAIVSADEKLKIISEGLEISDLEQCGPMAAAAIKEVQDIQEGTVVNRNVYTGYKLLDAKTKGMKPGAVYVIAARPGIGKTAFALNIAGNVALDYGRRVAIFSLEMDSVSLCKRILSQRSGIPHDSMDTRGKMTKYEIQRLVSAYKQLSESQLYIDDFALNTPAQIYNKCKRLARNDKGLDLIIIDYLQLMNPESGVLNRQEIVAQLSRSIKLYAKELGVPIIVLSQLRRTPTTEEGVGGVKEDRKPQLSDLRESGSIEQDADMVMFLHKPKGVDSTQSGSLIELIIQKNRSGAQGTINLAWYPERTSFAEHPNQGPILEPEKTVDEKDLEPVANAPVKPQEFVEEDEVDDTDFDVENDNLDGDIPF